MHSSHLQQIKQFLEDQHQSALWNTLHNLSPTEQAPIIETLTRLSHDFPTHPIKPKPTHFTAESFVPFRKPLQDSPMLYPLGETALREGKVLGIILAGGDGSRLGLDQPKGCFPISPFKKKSLFQLQVEKILALQKQLECRLPLALLTSPNNHAATVDYFKNNQFFGLDPEQLLIFIQPMLPLYDTDGNWFFKNTSQLSMAPNGNGGLLTTLKSQETFWSSYHYCTIISIDNPLATLYDIPLISTHIHHASDVSLRCFRQDLTPQNVGILAYLHQKLSIVDYTSLQDRSTFPYGNINILCFSTAFLKTLIQNDLLSTHWVEKKGVRYDPTTKTSITIPVFKGEKFLTDTIALAHKVVALDSSVEEHFAPLKNLHGINDVTSVRAALLHKDQKILQTLTGIQNPTHPIELSMEFHYPDKKLKQKCRSIKKWPAENYLSAEVLK